MSHWTRHTALVLGKWDLWTRNI